MSSSQERLTRNIRNGVTAVAASAIVLAGAGCDYKNTQNINLSPCDVKSQPTTIDMRIKEGDSVNIGALTITKGDKSGEFDAHLKSRESNLSTDIVENGHFFVDSETGRTVKITGQKDWNWFRSYTKLEIEANCDQQTGSAW